jgi:hypothetical protein
MNVANQITRTMSEERTPGRLQAVLGAVRAHGMDVDLGAAHPSWIVSADLIDAARRYHRERALREGLASVGAAAATYLDGAARATATWTAALASIGRAAVCWTLLTPEQRHAIRRRRTVDGVYRALLPSLLAGDYKTSLAICRSLERRASTRYHVYETHFERRRQERHSLNMIRAGTWIDVNAAASMLGVNVRKAREMLTPVYVHSWWNNGERHKCYYARSDVTALTKRSKFHLVSDGTDPANARRSDRAKLTASGKHSRHFSSRFTRSQRRGIR